MKPTKEIDSAKEMKSEMKAVGKKMSPKKMPMKAKYRMSADGAMKC